MLHLQGNLNHLSGADKVHLFNAVNLWIRNLVIRKRVEDLQLRIKSYQTMLNLIEPSWDATDFLFKEDYTIVSKPRAIIYKDRNDKKKMMRETENRIWSEDDKRRSKEFIEVIERRLKIRRIFRSLESFVSGRRSDTYAGIPVKDILLNLNLPDYKSVLTEPEVQVKMEMEIPCSSRVNGGCGGVAVYYNGGGGLEMEVTRCGWPESGRRWEAAPKKKKGGEGLCVARDYKNERKP
uniref:Uncharacterized protein n=1 Tax=Tanacetum cinerariifolium TaxID=118510 RepID=A0A6L2KEM4_TANCI|nr:hypothetical protein [Tanacetum cinerariifolium]